MIYTLTHKKFDKSFKKLNVRLQSAIKLKLRDFVCQENLKQLNDHELDGKWKNYRSINVTGDYRAIYRVIENKPKTVQFVAIVTHSELYD